MIETFVQVKNMKQLEQLQKKYPNVDYRKIYKNTLYVYVGSKYSVAGWTAPKKFITFEEWKLMRDMGAL